MYLSVQLSGAAPQSGATVTLASNAAAFPVPSSIFVPAGQSTASVNLQPQPVTVTTSVTVKATYNGTTKSTSVTLAPWSDPTSIRFPFSGSIHSL